MQAARCCYALVSLADGGLFAGVDMCLCAAATAAGAAAAAAASRGSSVGPAGRFSVRT
eukprot:COSAG01_NODE_5432_length_4265_cov_142.429189_3_plen_58_part_00